MTDLLTEMERTISKLSDENLDREIAYAVGFDDADDPFAVDWLNALVAAKQEREAA